MGSSSSEFRQDCFQYTGGVAAVICVFLFSEIARPFNVGDTQNLWSALYSVLLLTILRKHLVIGQFNFSSIFSVFHWLPSISKLRITQVSLSRPQTHMRFHWSHSIGKPCMTLISFVKTMESYEVSPRIIRGFRMGHRLGSTFTKTGRLNYRIRPYCVGRP